MHQQFNTLIKIAIILLCCHSAPSLAKLSASIDRTDIAAGETFVLDIQLDEDLDVQPDLSMIPKDFTIVSNSQYHQSQFINGSRSTLKGWKLKLKTLNAGQVIIPAIPVGEEFTQEFSLNIKSSDNKLDLNGQDNVIFMESTIDQQSPYVQQQIIFTISLYRAVNTHYAQLTEPVAENSLIEKLGDDASFEKSINGIRYTVTQRRYAVFPQQSGELTISGVNFTADVNDSNRRNMGGFLNPTRPVSISTQPIKLTVKPQPTNINQLWMPAQKVILVDKWTPDGKTLKVGEPTTWTLLLSVQGLSESQLPEISVPKINGLQWYYDTPQKERQINEKGILGQRIEKIAVIPSQAGSITIPEIKIDWWDVTTDSLQSAILPARTLNIQPADVSSTPTNILPPIAAPVVSETSISTDDNTQLWKNIALALLALWLLTLLAFFRKSGSLFTQSKPKAVAKQDNLGTRQLVSRIKTCLQTNAMSEVERLLMLWLAESGYSSIRSLGRLIQRLTQSNFSEESIIEKLTLLEAARYSAQQHELKIEITSADLDRILEGLSNQQHPAVSSTIPPLYPR